MFGVAPYFLASIGIEYNRESNGTFVGDTVGFGAGAREGIIPENN